jgi:hypothetical protein
LLFLGIGGLRFDVILADAILDVGLLFLRYHLRVRREISEHNTGNVIPPP